MGTAFRRRNIIDETVNIFIVAVIMLKCNFHKYTVFFAFTVNNLIIQRCIGLIQISHILADTAFIVERGQNRLFLTDICQRDTKSLCQKSNFSQTLFQYFIIKNCFFKYFFIRQEMDRCSSLLCRTDLLQFTHDFTAFITLIIFITIYINIDFKPFGQGINNRCTDTMKSAGYLISAAAEFTAGMKNGKYNFYRRFMGFCLYTDRYTTSVVDNCNGIVFINGHLNMITVTGKGLIDGIVNNLIYQMMKSLR